jgi:type IV pilus assembly protein PilX
MALVASLLLLVVVTLMAVAMFRSYGIQERIAGNVREKQRALHAAQVAEQYAEYWLSGNAASTASITCTTLLDGTLNQGQICNNRPIQGLASDGTKKFDNGVTGLPWKIGGTNVGVTYVPQFGSGIGMNVSTDVMSATQDATHSGVYFDKPRYYISDLGKSADGSGAEVYQIDAAGYGSTAETAAVIESTFQVGAQSWRADQP